jgi:hypothetical protein
MAGNIGSNAVTDGLIYSIDPNNPKSSIGRAVSSSGGNQLVATSEYTTRNDMIINTSSSNAGGYYNGFHNGWNILNGDISISQPIVIEYEVIENTMKDTSGNDVLTARFKGTQFGPYDMFADDRTGVPISVGKHTYMYIADGEDFNGSGRMRLYMSIDSLASGQLTIRNRKIYKLNYLYNMSPYREQNASLNNGVLPRYTDGSNYGVNCLDFDGTDDLLYTDGYRYTRAMGHTTEGWFRFPSNASGSWHGLWGRGLGDGGYMMFHNNGDICWYSSYTNSIAYLYYDSGLELNNHITLDGTTWYQIAIAYDPATENHLIYLNGELKATRNITWALDVVDYSGGIRYIGSGAGRYGIHTMGLFRHYNKCLSASEIKQNFEASRAIYGA